MRCIKEGSSVSLKTPGLSGPFISKEIVSLSVFDRKSKRYLALKAISFSSPVVFASTSIWFFPTDGALAEINILFFWIESFIIPAVCLAKHSPLLWLFAVLLCQQLFLWKNP